MTNQDERVALIARIAKVTLATTLLAGVVAVASMPAPYLIERPGPVFNLLGEVAHRPAIEVDGLATYPTSGALNLVTVDVLGSRAETPKWAQIFAAWVAPDQAIVPLDVIYPPNEDPVAVNEQNAQDFTDSTTAAKSVVLRELAIAENRATPAEFTFNLTSIGGPSGGLMFALALYDQLTPGELTGGHLISGTGTIDADGSIGAIGGLQQKLYGAAAAKSKYFLAPADNCSEVSSSKPKDLTVYSVSTFDEALEVVRVIARDGDASGFMTCN